jgi:hypothetical protein
LANHLDSETARDGYLHFKHAILAIVHEGGHYAIVLMHRVKDETMSLDHIFIAWADSLRLDVAARQRRIDIMKSMIDKLDITDACTYSYHVISGGDIPTWYHTKEEVIVDGNVEERFIGS